MDSYEIYVVQAGDTLFGIASRFDLTIAELQAVNQLPDPNRLVIGQALLIPLPRRSPLRYTVITGDTLFGLAQLFNTTVQVIAAANNLLDPNLIYPGQSLVIPAGPKSPTQCAPATPCSPSPAASMSRSIRLPGSTDLPILL